MTTARNDALHLLPQVLLHAVDDENGFVETPDGVRRIRGRTLPDLVRNPQPAPDGVRQLLAGLRAEGLLGEPGAPEDPRPAPAIAVAGAPALAGPAAEALGVRRLDDLPADPPALVLLAVASLADPRTTALARDLVGRGVPHLPFGLVSSRHAFVAPVWTPDAVGACLDCLRLRLYSNDVHGRTRTAYEEHLAATGAQPLVPAVAPALALHLTGLAGWHGRRWLDDPDADPGGRLTWLDTGDLQTTAHPLLVVADCPGCGAARRAHDAPVRRVAGLEDAEDPLTGVVHRLTLRQADSGPRIYLSSSVSADFGQFRPAQRVTINGGAGFTRSAAASAALGESVERYAAGVYDRTRFRLSTWRDLDEEAAHPDSFAFFSPEQHADPGLGFAPFTADTPVRWVRAVRHPDRRPVWVPAGQVYVPYRRAREEAEVAPSISTGLAAGPTAAAAALSGLQEVLERDALAISWLHRLPPREVPAEAVRASAAVSGHLADRSRWSVRFADLSLDTSVPVVAAVMEYRHGREHVLSFGSACRTELPAAVEKAFLEAAQGQTFVRRLLLREFRDWEPREDFSDVDEFNKHAVLYTKRPELRERAGYLVHPTEPPRPLRPARRYPAPADGDPAAVFERLVAELAALGSTVYVVDLTTPDAAQLGVSVVRVLVPGLQHLAGVHRYRFLGGRRLHDLPAALGFPGRPDNPFPHPLP
ncbi:TOMM precursor leader peptide-binding protein [Geodermatophilus sp. SYSU D01186]